jgi:hypothetical protein
LKPRILAAATACKSVLQKFCLTGDSFIYNVKIEDDGAESQRIPIVLPRNAAEDPVMLSCFSFSGVALCIGKRNPCAGAASRSPCLVSVDGASVIYWCRAAMHQPALRSTLWLIDKVT